MENCRQIYGEKVIAVLNIHTYLVASLADVKTYRGAISAPPWTATPSPRMYARYGNWPWYATVPPPTLAEPTRYRLLLFLGLLGLKFKDKVNKILNC